MHNNDFFLCALKCGIPSGFSKCWKRFVHTCTCPMKFMRVAHSKSKYKTKTSNFSVIAFQEETTVNFECKLNTGWINTLKNWDYEAPTSRKLDLYEMISYSAIGGSHNDGISILEIRSMLGETFFEKGVIKLIFESGVIKLVFESGYSETGYKLDTSG